MVLSNLVPFRKGGKDALAHYRREADPFAAFQRQMNRLVEDFFGETGLKPFGAGDRFAGSFTPTLDIAENDREVTVTAELPGLEDKDIQISIQNDRLTLRGEKKAEHEGKDAQHYVVERSYGAFSRAIQLPAEVDDSKAEAVFKNGVLKIRLPKTPTEKNKTKRIEIKHG
ncbi:MAG TPA: Hsp20/alpha crystallin family protein [Phycisphaerales bacterium]|nr:Hsp20/alpha crystallin family protein [Phycisphaerales bacterium]